MARSIPIPDDWDPETGGWETAIFCYPDSAKWQALVRGWFTSAHYGWLYDETTGSITDLQDIINQIYGGLCMDCNTYLDRIATALESLDTKAGDALDVVDSQYIDLADFQGLLETAGLDKFAGLIDWLGEWSELAVLIAGLIPDFDLKFKRSELIELAKGLFQIAGLREDLRNIAVQQHAVASVTGGPSIGTIVAALQAAIPNDQAIRMLLGNLDESLTIVSNDVLNGLLGNYMTNRVDDVRNAINGGSVLPGDNIVTQMKALKAQMALTELKLEVALSGGSDCGCFEVGPPEEDPTDEVESGVGEVPPDFEDWDEYDQAKCAYANKITEEIIDLVGVGVGLTSVPALVAVGAIVTAIVLAVSGGGFVLVTAGLIAGTFAIIAYTAIAYMVIQFPLVLGSWKTELEGTRNDIICDLMEATTPESAKVILLDWMTATATTASSDTTWLGLVDDLGGNLINNNLVNGLITSYPPLEGYIGDFDCQVCNETPLDWIISPYTYVANTSQPGPNGTGTITTDGTSFTITAVPFTYNSGANNGYTLTICQREVLTMTGVPAEPDNGNACSNDPSQLWVKVISAIPSGASLLTKGCSGGSLVNMASPGQNNLQPASAHKLIHIHRATPFEMTFQLHPYV